MKNVKNKIILVLVLSLMSILTLYGCSNQTAETPEMDASETQQMSTNLNPLTGLEIDQEKISLRPVCVMINNMHKGQPLFGVNRADLLYECPIEGGITRIMSVFKDISTADTIGSVRSARPYFINIAKGFESIYIHLGGSDIAYQILKSGYIDSIDLKSNEAFMWRDPERRKNLGFEHSALTSGEKILAGINKKGFSKELSNTSFKYNFSDNSPVLNGSDANRLTVTFSGYKNTIFDYNKEKETYYISQFKKPQMDAMDNVQNSKPNVFVLNVHAERINNTELLNINLHGNGTGKYMSHGKIIDINWHRESDNVPFTYTTSDNKPLTILPGQSYICVLPSFGKINIE